MSEIVVKKPPRGEGPEVVRIWMRRAYDNSVKAGIEPLIQFTQRELVERMAESGIEISLTGMNNHVTALLESGTMTLVGTELRMIGEQNRRVKVFALTEVLELETGGGDDGNGQARPETTDDSGEIPDASGPSGTGPESESVSAAADTGESSRLEIGVGDADRGSDIRVLPGQVIPGPGIDLGDAQRMKENGMVDGDPVIIVVEDAIPAQQSRAERRRNAKASKRKPIPGSSANASTASLMGQAAFSGLGTPTTLEAITRVGQYFHELCERLDLYGEEFTNTASRVAILEKKIEALIPILQKGADANSAVGQSHSQIRSVLGEIYDNFNEAVAETKRGNEQQAKDFEAIAALVKIGHEALAVLSAAISESFDAVGNDIVAIKRIVEAQPTQSAGGISIEKYTTDVQSAYERGFERGISITQSRSS